jgi:hypothetical protein
MNPDLRKPFPWPGAFAILFFLLPVLLANCYPSSLWANTDYQTEGLADALNMAYRIADHRMYFARGMADHPGVPFYLMNWLALAIAGYPVASSGPGFLKTVIEQAEVFHQITIWLGALMGAIGVYIFARTARKLVPIGVVAAGLLIWLASTPTTLLMFASPAIESFAILINALFFVVLVRLAYDRDITSRVTILCGGVGAFAYLNKLSYIYVPIALLVAGIANLSFRKVGKTRARQLIILAVCTFLLALVVVATIIIGWPAFLILLRFHARVFLGSGLYGGGAPVVVSGNEVWNAFAAIPVDRAYAIIIALVSGPCLVIGGFLAGRKGPEHVPAALIGIGTGTASFFSALFVLKHYHIHYTAGISATLPATAVAAYLLVKSWDYRLRRAAAALVAITILLMAYQMPKWLLPVLAGRTHTSELAKADLQEIQARLSGRKLLVEFGYGAPFAESGEGFIITFGSVPRLSEDYLLSRGDTIASMASNLVDQDAGAYVMAKTYFRTAESIRAASNLSMFGRKPVTFKDGDELIELRTAFLLIRGGKS